MNLGDLWAAFTIMGTRVPYDEMPWAKDDRGRVIEETEWVNASWNPVPGSAYAVADPNAGEKPTWAELTGAIDGVKVTDLRKWRQIQLRRECYRRICEDAYGESTFDDEVMLRLGARHLEAQDTERERLRGRYTVVKGWIAAASLAILEPFDVTDDSHWGDTWTEP